jgi:hypothetical protein
MTISGVSFSIYYLFYARRRVDAVLDQELVAYLVILVGATLSVWMVLILEGTYGASWGEALRDSAFSVSSILTTTGFVTADFDKWETSPKLALVLLMFIGGCAGSTAGGNKGHPDPDRLPHDLPGHFQDSASQGRHAAADRREAGARRGADSGARALRCVVRGIRRGGVPRLPPGWTHFDLLSDRGCSNTQRGRTGVGPSRGLRELRDRRPLWMGDTHGLHVARST